MLDPNIVFPTNNKNLRNDNYIMLFNTSNASNTRESSRLVPYLTIKKRLSKESINGGLNAGGKALIGNGQINPKSLLNNTLLNPSLVYRFRLIVFTNEHLYSISDALNIPPFEKSTSISLSMSIYITIIVVIVFCIILIVGAICLKKYFKKRNEKNINKYIDNLYDIEKHTEKNVAPPLPSKQNMSVNNPAYWTKMTDNVNIYNDIALEQQTNGVDNPMYWTEILENKDKYYSPPLPDKQNNSASNPAYWTTKQHFVQESICTGYMDVSSNTKDLYLTESLNNYLDVSSEANKDYMDILDKNESSYSDSYTN